MVPRPRLTGANGSGQLLQEEELIERFFRDLAARRDDVVLGIGDDAAVLRPAAGQELVAAVDSLNEGVHFPSTMPPSAVGHRLLAVNLSDLAAMGANPAWATLSLSLPTPDEDWLRGFAEGLGALARRHGVALVGGDTVRGPLSLSLQLLGFVPAGDALTRAGAGPGDGIYVTGEPGLAAAGLRRLQASRPLSDPLVQAFLWPQPRVSVGQGLRGVASAAIDVSDGLVTDLRRLLGASGCGARLDAASLPLGGLSRAGVDPDEALDFALAGGDDYELLFTVPAALEPLLAERSPAWDVEVSRIGEVERAPGLRISGGPDELPTGWRHFDGGPQ